MSREKAVVLCSCFVMQRCSADLATRGVIMGGRPGWQASNVTCNRRRSQDHAAFGAGKAPGRGEPLPLLAGWTAVSRQTNGAQPAFEIGHHGTGPGGNACQREAMKNKTLASWISRSADESSRDPWNCGGTPMKTASGFSCRILPRWLKLMACHLHSPRISSVACMCHKESVPGSPASLRRS